MLLLRAGRLLAIGTFLLALLPERAPAIFPVMLEDGRFSGVVLDAGRVVWLDENRATPRLRLFDGTTRDRKSTRLNSSHSQQSRMPSSA